MSKVRVLASLRFASDKHTEIILDPSKHARDRSARDRSFVDEYLVLQEFNIVHPIGLC